MFYERHSAECQACNRVFSLSAKYRRWVLRRRTSERMSEFVTRCFTRNFILCPEKCSPSRADKVPVLFDYVVYVPNVIKVTSIAQGGGVFRPGFCSRSNVASLTVKVSGKTEVPEEEREESSRRKRESKFPTALCGTLGAALNWIESSRGNDEEESPPVRSFRVLNFNYFELRSQTLGSKRRSICRW